jgi:N-methylhydantoinase B/oxoprolinase/acetone carboxylase alpha subunit
VTETRFDPIALAVTSSRLEGVVRSMRNTLTRASRSGVVNIARDFSCCIVSANDEILQWAESLPIQVLCGPELMARSMKQFHPRLSRGDAFLHNSPYHGATHAADHSILIPVIDDSGTHQFTVVARAHQADCGNATPTAYAATARDVYEEGALIFPCVRAQQDYVDSEDLIRTCRLRIRVPDQWWGDYLALVGAARIGERQMLSLGDELGWDNLQAFAAEWLRYSERMMAEAIGKLPAGRITVETRHDPIPGLPDGIPVRATIDIKSKAGAIEVDLRDNLDCLPCGLNLSESTARAAVLVGIFNSVDHRVPPNGGSARRVSVLLRENCVVGIPRHPASCSVATTNVFDRLANAVQRGVAELAAGYGMAETGLSLPASVSVISGNDPRHGGTPFINQLILAWTGGPGGPAADGWLTMGGPGDGGALLRDSVEIDELKHPIVVWDQRLLPDTEGAGRRRGAPSAYGEFGPMDTRMEAFFLSDGTVNPPRGVRGGQSGGRAAQFRRGADGKMTPLDLCGSVVLEAGERLVSVSTGGGGYGPPHEREPELVADDVREEWITPAHAAEVYRVAISESGEIDAAATRSLRSSAAVEAQT